jgi:CHASE2 domain-containing sensor protein
MNLPALSGLLLAATGWVLFAMMGLNLLSGHFDDRSCHTDCVKSLFLFSVAAGISGLLLSGIGVFRPNGRILGIIALLAALALCSVFLVLFIAGNFI